SAPKEIEIFTVGQMRLRLRHVSLSVLPALVLGGFAGLRTSEVQHLCWEHVHWDKGLITVPQGKTGKRLAPLFDNARDWLKEAWMHATPADGGSRIVRVTANTVTNGMVRAAMAAQAELSRQHSAQKITWK